MTLSHARALLINQHVEVQHFDQQHCEQALHALGHWAMRFCPTVSVDSPDGLLLDITGCTHLSGGSTPLAQRVIDDLNRLGIGARVAIAPTFAAAWALARFSPEPITVVDAANTAAALSPLPIAALQLDADIIATLGELGVERIEQLLDLPRSALPSRFGDDLIFKIDQLSGASIYSTGQIVDPLRPRDPLVAQRCFAGPTTNIEGIALTVQQLLRDLCLRLAQREAAAERLSIECDRVDSDPTGFTVRLSLPSRDAKHLWSLIRPRIEKLHLGYGVEQITIRALRISGRPHAQGQCWHQEHTPGHDPLDKAIGQMADAMIERFGPHQVLRAQAVESHLPERCVRYRAWLDDPPLRTRRTKTLSDKQSQKLTDADRPTLIFARPKPIQVMAITPQGPPIWLRMDGDEQQITAYAGPERITAPWWGNQPDAEDRSAGSARDYFKVQDQLGRWLWVYRDLNRGLWFAHGQWA